MERWRIYEQAFALLDELRAGCTPRQLSSGAFRVEALNVQQLTAPWTGVVARTWRDSSGVPTVRTRFYTIPVGWWMARASLSDPGGHHLAVVAYGPNYERTRRKVRVRLYRRMLLEHAAGRWPVEPGHAIRSIEMMPPPLSRQCARLYPRYDAVDLGG